LGRPIENKAQGAGAESLPNLVTRSAITPRFPFRAAAEFRAVLEIAPKNALAAEGMKALGGR
jgi:hypothetical protein